MSEYNEDKYFEAFKIPKQKQTETKSSTNYLTVPKNYGHEDIIQNKSENRTLPPLTKEMFYEIEYDSSIIPGAGKFVLKSREFVNPEMDEIRTLFNQMRDIAKKNGFAFDYTRFFDKRIRNNKSEVFYKQGIFMKDFSDDYSESIPFSQYFPDYQMMGYKQLRTYFTWRTKLRSGDVTDTSLSYAFIYIYELLNGIGVKDPQDGLDKLMLFWKSFRVFNPSVDKYVIKWLRDYYIYYGVPHSFDEFVEKNNISEYYPKVTDTSDNFDFYCSVSKYDLKKSAFFDDESSEMIKNCFSFIMKRINKEFITAGILLEDVFYRPKKKMTIWIPFKDALFYQCIKQPDKRVILSENEIYICSSNEWTYGTIITNDKGKQFVGYVMKKMEALLRQFKKYKFKLTANSNMINTETLQLLSKSGIDIEKIVTTAVMDFYREMTKTVVEVDDKALDRIRREALVIQEALTVEEQMEQMSLPLSKQSNFTPSSNTEPTAESTTESTKESTTESDSYESNDIWERFKEALSSEELQALSIMLNEGDIKAYADSCGSMLEVLIDGINEKSIDCIGDNLIDEEISLYEDYIEEVRKCVKL